MIAVVLAVLAAADIAVVVAAVRTVAVTGRKLK